MSKKTGHQKPKRRELLRVYATDDGALECKVSASWEDHPNRPEQLSRAVSEAIIAVLGGDAEVGEFRLLNRSTGGKPS